MRPSRLQSALVTGLLTTGCLGAIAANTQAQVVVTGGNLTFQGTQVFVPTSGNTADVYNGRATALLQTRPIVTVQQGGVKVQGLVNNTILPQLNIQGGGQPAVGNTGRWLPTVTFVGQSPSGQPTLYLNIPADLSFQVNSLQSQGTAAAINKYETEPLLLRQTGVSVNASSVRGVQRLTPVVLVDFGTSVPSNLSGYQIAKTIPGQSFPTDFTATITEGQLSTPTNTFDSSSNGSSGSNNGSPNSGNDGSTFNSGTTYIAVFSTDGGSTTTVYTLYSPTLDREVQVRETDDGDDDNGNDDNGNNNNGNNNGNNRGGNNNRNRRDREVQVVDPATNRTYVIVGLPSRVFPGLIGLQPVSDSD